jgi:hypothetical protein
VLFFRKGAVMAETGRSSGKVKNPNADPRQKHSQHSPHSPRQNPGDGEPGNVGKGGKDIPVNDMVSSRIPRKPRSRKPPDVTSTAIPRFPGIRQPF